MCILDLMFLIVNGSTIHHWRNLLAYSQSFLWPIWTVKNYGLLLGPTFSSLILIKRKSSIRSGCHLVPAKYACTLKDADRSCWLIDNWTLGSSGVWALLWGPKIMEVAFVSSLLGCVMSWVGSLMLGVLQSFRLLATILSEFFLLIDCKAIAYSQLILAHDHENYIAWLGNTLRGF